MDKIYALPSHDKISKPEKFVDIVEDGFGVIRNKTTGTKEIVRRFTMSNQNGFVVQIITYGATITSIKCPDKHKNIEDVVLGYDDIEGYLSKNNPYFGAIVGRVANRIAKGRFKIGQTQYQVSLNRGDFHLHGGYRGFDKVIWESHVEGNKLTLSYCSKDGEEGYPGELLVSATYTMSTENILTLEMKATSSKPTPVNLTNHSYFNLAGHGAGAQGLYEHLISINADRFTLCDENFIPTGALRSVSGTMLDLRIPRLFGDVIHYIPYGGFDQNLCVNIVPDHAKTFVARVVHPRSGRSLEVQSNQPGVQLYTANYFPDPRDGDNKDESKADEIIGKKNVRYYKHHGFCLETQAYPDSVNHKNFPNTILKPGETYYHIVTYRFGTYEEINLEPDLNKPVVVDLEAETLDIERKSKKCQKK